MKKKYLKAEVREYDGEIRTNFLDNVTQKENMYYTCIACITIDSVIKTNKKNYPNYQEKLLGEHKYKIKNSQMSKFINVKLESDLDSDLDSDLNSDVDL